MQAPSPRLAASMRGVQPDLVVPQEEVQDVEVALHRREQDGRVTSLGPFLRVAAARARSVAAEQEAGDLLQVSFESSPAQRLQRGGVDPLHRDCPLDGLHHFARVLVVVGEDPLENLGRRGIRAGADQLLRDGEVPSLTMMAFLI